MCYQTRTNYRCAYRTSLTTYIWEQNLSIYYAEANAPCEVQVYMKAPGQVLRNCEKQILSKTILWITLTEKQLWLYLTLKPQEITIKYDNEIENKIILKKIRKSSVSRKCKITTPHVTIRTQKTIKAKVIQAYLPKFNLTLDYKSNKEIKNRIKIAEKQN